MSESNIERLRKTYLTEAGELLDDIEQKLLDLENNPGDMDLVDHVFRIAHTIKGSGAMFGFDDIARFTHDLEDVLDKVRGGKLAVTAELIQVALLCGDHIRAMVGGNTDEAAGVALLARLRGLGAASAMATPPPPTAADAVTYRIGIRLDAKVLRMGTNPILLLRELRDLGECTVHGHDEDLPLFEDMDPELCYLHWNVTLTTTHGEQAIRDVFIFVEDECELTIEALTPDAASKPGADDPDTDRLPEAPDDGPRVLLEQPHSAPGGSRRAGGDTAKSIRVPAARLDTLVDLVGELVIAQARLSQLAASSLDPSLRSIAEDVELLSSNLQENAMSLRMVPIGTTFDRYRRLVRDLSSDLGREVNLVTEGGDTELDKTVIERLGDPLVHIIRNSIDHGIELPDAREAAGKPRIGTVRLSARHSGGVIVVEIADDGGGLDAEGIRARAIERGLLAADAVVTDQQLSDFIFHPGFSTAAKVSNVSGRGVGMDVVKRSVEELRGTIVTISAAGEGTTFTIQLPLTLAIIDGLLVEVGGEMLVIPLELVGECIELTRDDIARQHGREVAEVRGHLVPYVELRKWIGLHGERPAIEQVVLIEFEGRSFGLVVDGVVGQIQAVIKSLGKLYENIDGIAGGTILGDGNVALIVDAPQLLRKVMSSGDSMGNLTPSERAAPDRRPSGQVTCAGIAR
ncbi:MAG: chemotaxis protein CheA [Planctomycetes bacterium]|nr:chemotaxis protein CheA [Planctomycetota bacterium]